MRLQVAHHLQPVLERPQEPVRVGERVRVGLGHVPGRRERGQRRERVRLAEPLVAAAVDDLQELDGELDVADPAPAALDLDRGLAPRPDVLLQPDLDLTNLVDRLRRKLLRIHERGHHRDEPLAEIEISGDGTRFQQRLPLPGRRLVRVVLAHRVERTRQRAAAASRAERRVDAERESLRRRVGQEPDQLRGDPVGGFLLRASALAVNEHDVDVRGVVQLVSAQLPESDHRQVLRTHGDARVREARLGDRRDLLDDLLQPGAAEIAGGDPEHRASPEPSQRVGGTEPFDVRRELGVEFRSGTGPHVGERNDLIGMRDEEVGRRGGEAEQPDGNREDVVAGEDRPCRRILADTGDRDARELGIGCVRECSPEHLGRQHERGSVASGTNGLSSPSSSGFDEAIPGRPCHARVRAELTMP